MARQDLKGVVRKRMKEEIQGTKDGEKDNGKGSAESVCGVGHVHVLADVCIVHSRVDQRSVITKDIRCVSSSVFKAHISK